MFTPPKVEDLKGFSVAGLTDLAEMARTEHASLVASIDTDNATDEQISQLKDLQAFVAAASEELQARIDKAEQITAASVLPQLPKPAEIVTPVETVTASAEPAFSEDGSKAVTETTPAPTGDGQSQVLEGTIVAAGAVTAETRRSVQPAEVAPFAPAPQVVTGDDSFTIVAAADLASFPMGSTLTYDTIGRAFEDRTRAYPGMAKSKQRGRAQHALAT